MQKKSDSALSLVSGGLAAAVLLAGPSAALAGGNGILVYGPLAVSVPTLGGWVLPVLAGLLAVIALRILRAKGAGGKTAAVAAIGAGAMMAAGAVSAFYRSPTQSSPPARPFPTRTAVKCPCPLSTTFLRTPAASTCGSSNSPHRHVTNQTE